MNPYTIARKHVESLYDGVCNITNYSNDDGVINDTVEEIQTENMPCRLSYSSIPNTQTTEAASIVVQNIKLFLNPEIAVPPGSKIEVTQNNSTVTYKSSGQPAIYKTHQEINLEIFKGWA